MCHSYYVMSSMLWNLCWPFSSNIYFWNNYISNFCSCRIITIAEFDTYIVFVPNKSMQNNKPSSSEMPHPLCFCFHFKSLCTKRHIKYQFLSQWLHECAKCKMMETRILAKPQNWKRISNIVRECTSNLLNSFTLILGNINNILVGVVDLYNRIIDNWYFSLG